MAFAGLNEQSTYRALNSLACPRRAFPTPARKSLKAIPAIAFSVRFPTHEIRSSLANLKFTSSLRFSSPTRVSRRICRGASTVLSSDAKAQTPVTNSISQIGTAPGACPAWEQLEKIESKKRPRTWRTSPSDSVLGSNKCSRSNPCESAPRQAEAAG